MKSQWTPAMAKAWYQNRPLLLGYNFLPSSAVNAIEMFQAETYDQRTIEREVCLSADSGYNVLRVYVPCTVWVHDRAGLMARLEALLCTAARYELCVMPVLFDDCATGNVDPAPGFQGDPIPGVHNARWAASPGAGLSDNPLVQPMLEAFVTDIITTYRADARIALWDLYNEPGNGNRGDKSAALVESAFRWARACDPTQPLTVGPWQWPAMSAGERLGLALSDVISFHSYLNRDQTAGIIQQLRAYNRPLICTEWLNRPGGSLFQTLLPLFKEESVGCCHWGLVNGRTQTHLSWDTLTGHPAAEEPAIWQHDVFRKDLTPYDQSEMDLVYRYNLKEALTLSPIRMTKEIMADLHERGLIRLLTGRENIGTMLRGEVAADTIYQPDEHHGAHKLISVAVNRPRPSAFGIHPGLEEFWFCGIPSPSPLYLVIALYKQDVIVQKAQAGELSAADFLCLEAVYNDPDCSYFIMNADVPHGEAGGDSSGDAMFYVTEPNSLPLIATPLFGYRLEVAK